MAKFKLRQSVTKIGTQEVRTVEEIREGNGDPTSSIQFGRDFATRIWAKESELKPAEKSEIPVIPSAPVTSLKQQPPARPDDLVEPGK
jgi:hypothetical protein